MSINDIRSTGASLFQPVLYHDVHNSVSKSLGLASCLFKGMGNSINYILWLSGIHIVSSELDKQKCNCC